MSFDRVPDGEDPTIPDVLQPVGTAESGDASTAMADGSHRPREKRTGQALIDACAASPHREVEIAPQRGLMPVREPSP